MASHQIVDLVLSDDEDNCESRASSPSAIASKSSSSTSSSLLPIFSSPLVPMTSSEAHHLRQIDLTDETPSASALQLSAPRTRRARGGESSSIALPSGVSPSLPMPVPLPTPGLGSGSSFPRRARLTKCTSCLRDDVPRRETFCLEACAHQLCPTCVAGKICNAMQRPAESTAETETPVCPVCHCDRRVSTRDLALLLPQHAWGALQARRLTAFRRRVEKGVCCPGCSVWIEASPSDNATRSSGELVVDRGEGGGGGGKRSHGTVKERAAALLSVPELTCGSCRARACRFCGVRVGGRNNKATPASSHGSCIDWKLWAVAGLLDLLEQLIANPTDVALTGPVKAVAAASSRGRGRGRGYGGSRGGRGRGSRGGGRGGSWGGSWNSYMMGGQGGAGISSKWSKGTGYGGAGDEAAAAKALAVAQEAEGRADRAMVIVVQALTSCLPQSAEEFPEHLPELVALVRESSLLQTVCAYLRNDSLMDIAKRSDLYLSLFQLVKAFARHELLAPLVDNVPPKKKSDSGSLNSDGILSAAASAAAAAAGGGGGGGIVAGAGARTGALALTTGNDSSGSKGKGKGKAASNNSGDGASGVSDLFTVHAGSVLSTENSATVGGGGVAGDSAFVETQKESGVLEMVNEEVFGGDEEEEEEDDDDDDDDEDVSVADLLANTNRQAKVYAQAPGAEDGKGGAAAATLAFARQVIEVHHEVKTSLVDLKSLAESRTSTAAMSAIIAATGTVGVAGAGLGRKRKREELDIVEVSLESRYLRELGERRFQVVDLLGQHGSHHFASQVTKAGGGAAGRARAVRISQEVSSLATSLPCQPDSSIFLRVHEERFDVMRAMITGPKDTPYEGGCFEFDILLPPDYPNRPPHVHFLTTGGGRVRMNPNLYNTGKVCLSLLGTWAGPGWDAKNSTLLQVLVSIQSLIFVAEPYFNEPGFEGQLGTAQGKACSRSYNSRIRNATLMFGVVAALEAKSGPMRDVVRKHFRLVKGPMMRTAREWLQEAMQSDTRVPRYTAVDGGCNGDYATMEKTVNKMEALIAAL